MVKFIAGIFYLLLFQIQLISLLCLIVNIQNSKDCVNQLFLIQIQNVLLQLDILNHLIQRLSSAMFFKYFSTLLFLKYILLQSLETIFH